MIVRDDLKNTIQYKNAVQRYKINVKSSTVVYMIIFAIILILGGIMSFLESVGIIPEWLISILREDSENVNIGFIGWFVIFIGGEIFIFLWNICKLRNVFKIKEIFVDDKKFTETEDDTYYYVVENRKKYRVLEGYIYSNIQQGRSYCFLCRGRKILEIVEI